MRLTQAASRKAIKHDELLIQSLKDRLAVLAPARHPSLAADSFLHHSWKDLRSDVRIFEQLQARQIIDTYRAGPHGQPAFVLALMELARLAGEPLKRYFNATAGAINPHGPLVQGAEAREDVLDIVRTALNALGQPDPLPILIDKHENQMDDVLRYRSKWWLVHPLDGIQHDDMSISIALIDRGQPVAGIVHFPILQRTYGGIPAMNWAQLAMGARQRSIKVKPRAQVKHVAAASHGARSTPAFKTYRQSHDVKRSFGEVSPAYGLCRLAQGSIDLYLHPAMAAQVSLAAGHAVLAAAGGDILTLEGAAVRYSSNFAVPPFVATADRSILRMQTIKRLIA